ncbi:MAG: sulfite exporter TauE/SafE family protein [Pseudonocardiaceae bacterium]|nr:MAG: sulfite exporter TauE/SafE family protein [Pseudonocardiaceae bacterium]
MLLVGVVTMLLASVVGGMAGFAMSLLSAPSLLLAGFGFAEVVAINLTATLVSRVAVLWTFRDVVDRRRVALLVAGSAPGAVAGALTVGHLDKHVLTVATGIVVTVLGVLLLVAGRRTGPEPRAPEFVGTGVVGGFLSTSISLNGPPVAILLHRARLEPVQFVADFAGYFVVTNTLSLLILGVHGAIPTSILWPALPALVVAALIGNRLGTRLTTRIPQATFRTVVSALIVASGIVVIVS